MDTKQKYVRLKEYNQIINFHTCTEHSTFRYLNPISAGFFYVHSDKVSCFGKSISLNIEGMEDDSYIATKQIFGWEAADKFNNQKRGTK